MSDFSPCSAVTYYMSMLFMLQSMKSMLQSLLSMLKSLQMQGDVHKKILGEQDVTKEILEDVPKEILEEKKGATLILTQPSLRSGCVKL